MTDPVLQAVEISKSFGALKASNKISIDLRPGEIHAVIGPNGAGKSTLLAQICGGVRPDAGKVFFEGRDVSDAPTAARARAGLARTFQISALALEDTVLQNVMLGSLGATGRPWRFFAPAMRDRAMRDRAELALARVGLTEQAGLRVAELSHGQRRQLEVAVALTLKPKAFVMDEPMAGLGTDGSKRMTEFLDGLRTDAPILLVEHDMDAVFLLADRISVLVYGEVIETGSVAQIRKSEQVRRAYLGDEV